MINFNRTIKMFSSQLLIIFFLLFEHLACYSLSKITDSNEIDQTARNSNIHENSLSDLLKKMHSPINRKKNLNSNFRKKLRLISLLEKMTEPVESDYNDLTELMSAETEITWPRKFIDNNTNNFKNNYQLEKRNILSNQIDQKKIEEYLRHLLAMSLKNNNNYQEKKVITQEELDNIDNFQRIIQSFGR